MVETVEPNLRGGSGGSGTKEGNRKILEELAREQGVLDLLIEVADFVEAHMPAYRWPNKTNFAYVLNEVTEAGRPTQRSYGAVWVDEEAKGRVIFSLPDRAISCAEAAVDEAVAAIPEARLTSTSWKPFELPITSASWPEVRTHLEKLVAAVVAGWERRVPESTGDSKDIDRPSESA